MYPREEGNGGIRRREKVCNKREQIENLYVSFWRYYCDCFCCGQFPVGTENCSYLRMNQKGLKSNTQTYILFRISFFAYLFFFSSRCLVLFHNIGREKTFSTSERNSRCLLPLMYMPGGGISVADNPVDVRLHLCPSGWPDSSRRVECKLRYLKSGCPLYLTRFSQWYSVLDLRGLFYRPLIYYQ